MAALLTIAMTASSPTPPSAAPVPQATVPPVCQYITRDSAVQSMTVPTMEPEVSGGIHALCWGHQAFGMLSSVQVFMSPRLFDVNVYVT